MGTMVPMLSPDGKSGDVPLANVAAAKQSGFKVAVQMTAPDGQNGYIPADQVQNAAAKGFKMVPIQVQDAQKQSYWEALTNPIGSGGQQQKSASIASALLGPVGFLTTPAGKQIGGQAIKTMAQPVMHPLDTLQAMYGAVRHPIDTAHAIAQQVTNDYRQGGAALAGENLAGQTIGAIESGRIAAPVAQAAMNAAPAGIGRALLLGRTPEGAYESALKPSTTLSQTERDAAVQTGLQNAIPVSKAGVEKIGGLIDDLNQQIENRIQSAGPARTVNPYAAVKNLQDVRNKFATQVNPANDVAAIGQSGQEFLNQFRAQPGGAVRNLSVPEAQAMKQGTYRVLAGKYGEQGSAAVEAQKALARGLKDEIARQFPEIANLNAAESKLLDLQPVLERAVNRISNHQLIGIGTPVAGAATEAVTGSTTLGKVAMVTKAVLDNPNVKSRLAIALSKGGKIPYSQALARVQSYATSLGSFSSAAQGYSGAGSVNPAGNPQP